MTRKLFSHRSFIALISALSLAVAITGASAAPARAGDDTARVLAGIAALAIIGAAIEESRDDRAHVVQQRKVIVHQPPRHVYRSHGPRRPAYHAPRPRHHVYQHPRKRHHVQHRPHRNVKVIKKKIIRKRVVHVHRHR